MQLHGPRPKAPIFQQKSRTVFRTGLVWELKSQNWFPPNLTRQGVSDGDRPLFFEAHIWGERQNPKWGVDEFAILLK